MERLLIFPDSYCNSSVLLEELKCISDIDRTDFANFTFPLANQCTLNVPRTYSPCNLIPKHELPDYCSKMENIFQSPKKGPNYSPFKESIRRRQMLDEYLEEREKLLRKKYKRNDYGLVSPKREAFKIKRDEKNRNSVQKKCIMTDIRKNEKALEKIPLIKSPVARMSRLIIEENPKYLNLN